MQPNYYIAALPILTTEFYRAIEDLQLIECYPEIRLPFHSTIYYLGKITDQQKSEVVQWLQSLNISSLQADVLGVEYFKTDNNPSVGFLKLQSNKLEQLNRDMAKQFSDIHQDQFSFLPHLSIFFPKEALKTEDIDRINQSFSKIEKIQFKAIYLGSEIDNVTNVSYIKKLDQ